MYSMDGEEPLLVFFLHFQGLLEPCIVVTFFGAVKAKCKLIVMRLLLASFIVLPLDDVCDQFSRAFSFDPRRSFGNIKYTLLSTTPV